MGKKAGKSLLLKLMDRMGEVKVVEKLLPRDGMGRRVYGYTFPDGMIQVNLPLAVMDTIIHELIHSHYLRETGKPGSEATVKRLTERIMNEMSDGELQAFWDAYVRRVNACGGSSLPSSGG